MRVFASVYNSVYGEIEEACIVGYANTSNDHTLVIYIGQDRKLHKDTFDKFSDVHVVD